jgi:hypothetical protein
MHSSTPIVQHEDEDGLSPALSVNSTTSPCDVVGDITDNFKRLSIVSARPNEEAWEDDESEADVDLLLIGFEETHPWLRKIPRRSLADLTDPVSAAQRLYTRKPSTFFRVCDKDTFTKNKPCRGFRH